MKQGRATHSGMGSTKSEPISHVVPPAYAGRIGLMQGNHAESGIVHVQHVPMYEGRALEAPTCHTTVHHCGSQGKHK